MKARRKQITSAIRTRTRLRLARLSTTAGARHQPEQPDSLEVSDFRCCPWLVFGLSWLVLPVLPCFGALNQLFGAWKVVSFTPPPLQPNTRQNKLSSPGMVEYLACNSVWNACTWKNFSGPKKFFPSPRFLCNLIHAEKKNFRALAWWNIWPIALVEMPAPEKTFRDLKSFSHPRLLCNLIPRQNEFAKPSPYEPLKN